MLGIGNVRSIALAYATMEALPKPKVGLFNQEAFWTDSLLQAMLARSFAKKTFSGQTEDVFTASLLADVALPVLLSAWQEYYEPVVQEWMQNGSRLSEIERKHFGWDHAQAGAWIVHAWEFPEEVVCYIGAHNLSWEKICKDELEETILVPIAVATLSPSVLKPDPESSKQVFKAAAEQLSMTESEFIGCIKEVKDSLSEILELFGLPENNIGSIIEDMASATCCDDERNET